MKKITLDQFFSQPRKTTLGYLRSLADDKTMVGHDGYMLPLSDWEGNHDDEELLTSFVTQCTNGNDSPSQAFYLENQRIFYCLIPVAWAEETNGMVNCE